MNVLLVILDSVRAENTSLHNHVHDTTPFLSEFVESGATLYTQARSPGAWSLTSHTSIFSGLHVEEHQVTSAEQKLAPERSIFAQLSAEGYDTAVFSENNWITSVDVGLKEGFDEVFGHENKPFPNGITPTEFVAREGRGLYVKYLRECLTHDHPLESLGNGVATKLVTDYPKFAPPFLKASAPADTYVDRFVNWVDARDGPWAACLNLMDAHIPYLPDPEHDRWGGKRARAIQDGIKDYKWEFAGGRKPWWQLEVCKSLYDGGIHQADSAVKRLVDHLDARGELDKTLVVVTSDHGEGFGEASYLRPGVRIAEHGAAIHDAVMHVPLVVRFPGQDERAVVDDPATLTQFPSVVDAARDGTWEADAFVPRDGPVISSVMPIDRPTEERAGKYLDDLSAYTATARAVYDTDDRGRIRISLTWRDRSGIVEVPNERTDFVVDGSGRARVEEVFEDISPRDVRVDTGGVDAMDDQTYERLRDLGYV